METVTVDELEDMKCGVCSQSFSDETTHPCLVSSAELFVTEENYVIPIEHLSDLQKDNKNEVKNKPSPGRHSSRIAALPKRKYNEMGVGNNTSDSEDESAVKKKTKRKQDDGDDDDVNKEQENDKSSEERNALLAELDKDGGEMSESEFRTVVLKALRFIISNKQTEKRNSRHGFVKDDNICKRVRTMEDILKLEENLADTEFRSKWIEEFQNVTALSIDARTEFKAMGRIIMKTIFNGTAMQKLCYAGISRGKFALKPRDETSNILSAISEIFNFHGVHKLLKIKEAIQNTIYKCNDDQTRKLRERQGCGKGKTSS